jgi:hypothetical protein
LERNRCPRRERRTSEAHASELLNREPPGCPATRSPRSWRACWCSVPRQAYRGPSRRCAGVAPEAVAAAADGVVTPRAHSNAASPSGSRSSSATRTRPNASPAGSLLHSDGPLVAPATPATATPATATPVFASPSHLHSLLHELSPSTYLSPMPFPTSPDRDADGDGDGDGDVSRLLPFATPRGAPPTPTTQLISVGHSAGPGAGPSRSQSPISMRTPLGLRAETPLRKYRSVSRPPRRCRCRCRCRRLTPPFACSTPR